MDMDEELKVVVVVRYNEKIKYYRSIVDFWVLDYNKWDDDFREHGVDVCEGNIDEERFGIVVVNEETATCFLECMSEFEVKKDELGSELTTHFPSARSWWDVKELFPIMFIDFDKKKVGAFYSEGTPVEHYVPDGWIGEFIDFAIDYDEDTFPEAEKFWIIGDSNILLSLNEKGAVL